MHTVIIILIISNLHISFRLLKAANVYSVRRKAQPGYNKINTKRRPISRASTFEEGHLAETKTIEKVDRIN